MSVTREKLYNEIWTEPITKVSKRYGVSDSYLIRILKSLNIPRPSIGYWATLAAGTQPAKPPLPAAKLGDAVTWSRDVEKVFETSTTDEEKTTLAKQTTRIATHGLMREAQEYFKKVRDSRSPYLKPFKKLKSSFHINQNLLIALWRLSQKCIDFMDSFGFYWRSSAISKFSIKSRCNNLVLN